MRISDLIFRNGSSGKCQMRMRESDLTTPSVARVSHPLTVDFSYGY